MKLIVMTSDKHMPLLLPFSYLFNKYWGPDQAVTVCHYTQPNFLLPENFGYFRIGYQADYPFQKWSDSLIRVLNSIEEETVVIMLEDYWLCREVDRQAVADLNDFAIAEKRILKIDLMSDRLYAASMQDYASLGHLDLIKSSPSSAYHMSLMTGIWRVDNLLSVLIPNESAHDIEIRGTTRVREKFEDLLVLGTRQFPVRHPHVVNSQNPHKIDMTGIHAIDINYIMERGWA